MYVACIPATLQTIFPVDELSALSPPGLLIGLLGIPLFGTFAAIVLFMFLVSAISSSARSRGSSPRLGVVIGFLVLVIVMVMITVAVR